MVWLGAWGFGVIIRSGNRSRAMAWMCGVGIQGEQEESAALVGRWTDRSGE